MFPHSRKVSRGSWQACLQPAAVSLLASTQARPGVTHLANQAHSHLPRL